MIARPMYLRMFPVDDRFERLRRELEAQRSEQTEGPLVVVATKQNDWTLAHLCEGRRGRGLHLIGNATALQLTAYPRNRCSGLHGNERILDVLAGSRDA